MFAAVKFAPTTVILGAAGLALACARRGAGDRLVLAWIATWALTILPAAAKYGRLTVSMQPELLLLAAVAGVELAGAMARLAGRPRWGRAPAALATGAIAAALVVPEAAVALAHSPHYRL